MWIYVLGAVLASASFVYWYITRTFNYWKKRNIPYVQPVPLFGNFKEFSFKKKVQGEILQDVYNRFPDDKVVGLYAMTTPVVLLRDPEAIKHILVKDFDLFVNRGVEFSKEGLGQNLFHADGETWRVLRTRFTPIFTSGKLRNMFHLINESGDKMLGYIQNELKMQSEQNMLNLARMYTMSSIAACAFGLEVDNADSSLSTLNKIDDLVFSNKYHMIEVDFMFPGMLRKLNLSLFPSAISDFFNDLVKNVFAQRNGMPSNRNDFMDLILQMKQEKFIYGSRMRDDARIGVELSDSIVAAQAFVFYIAGYETSSTTLGFLLYEVSRMPDIQDKMMAEVDALLEKHEGKVTYDSLAELPYLYKVIDETLRMYPIVDPLQRQAMADYKIPGTDFTIKKEQNVFIPVTGLHYDPKYWPNPHQFDPERFSPENSKNRPSCAYLPFGEGPRHCIGMRFARVQSIMFLVKFLSRYRVEPSENTPKKIAFAGGRPISGPQGGNVPLKIVPRYS